MPRKATIMSIVNQKGGVGKTTSAINLCTAFAMMGRKTLLIDFDPQGNASTGLGINERSKSVYGVLIDQYSIHSAILETDIKNLSIICSNVDLSACEVELTNFSKREFILKNKIEEIVTEFDYIIIDCPPSLGLLTINALTAIDSILVPMQCEFFALEGLSHLLTTLDLIKSSLNPKLAISGIMLTMHDKRNKLTEQVEKDVRNFLGDIVFETIVPRNIKLSEAPSYSMPVITYDASCAGSLAYIKLAKEILQREEAKRNELTNKIRKYGS